MAEDSVSRAAERLRHAESLVATASARWEAAGTARQLMAKADHIDGSWTCRAARIGAAGVEVRYLAYPRAGRESASYAKMVATWCAHDRRALKAGSAIVGSKGYETPVPERRVTGSQQSSAYRCSINRASVARDVSGGSSSSWNLTSARPASVATITCASFVSSAPGACKLGGWSRSQPRQKSRKAPFTDFAASSTVGWRWSAPRDRRRCAIGVSSAR